MQLLVNGRWNEGTIDFAKYKYINTYFFQSKKKFYETISFKFHRSFYKIDKNINVLNFVLCIIYKDLTTLRRRGEYEILFNRITSITIIYSEFKFKIII